MPDEPETNWRERLYRSAAELATAHPSPMLIVTAHQLGKALARALSDYTTITDQALDRTIARLAIGNAMRSITSVISEASDVEPDVILPDLRGDR